MNEKKKNFPKILLNHSESFYLRKLFEKVKVKEVMVEDPITIDVNEPFSHVEEKFGAHQIRHLPVIDKDEILVGLMTQRDLYRIQPPRILEDGGQFYDKQLLDSNILEHVMIRNPKTLRPDDHVADAIIIMAEKKYGCIPIVNPNGVLLGIITQTDILRMAAQIIQE